MYNFGFYSIKYLIEDHEFNFNLIPAGVKEYTSTISEYAKKWTSQYHGYVSPIFFF